MLLTPALHSCHQSEYTSHQPSRARSDPCALNITQSDHFPTRMKAESYEQRMFTQKHKLLASRQASSQSTSRDDGRAKKRCEAVEHVKSNRGQPDPNPYSLTAKHNRVINIFFALIQLDWFLKTSAYRIFQRSKKSNVGPISAPFV